MEAKLCHLRGQCPSVHPVPKCGSPTAIAVGPAGVGSQLLVYGLPRGTLLQNSTVLPDAARVHGMHAVPLADGRLTIAVHGDHYAKVPTLEAARARFFCAI